MLIKGFHRYREGAANWDVTFPGPTKTHLLPGRLPRKGGKVNQFPQRCFVLLVLFVVSVVVVFLPCYTYIY